MNEKVSHFLTKTVNRLGYLAGRWADERKYEDINDYKTNLQTFCNTENLGVTIGGMIKRPFGFTFTFNDTPKSTFRCLVKMNGRVTVTQIL